MLYFFFSSRRRHTRYWRDWSSDVCSSDLFITLEDLYSSIEVIIFPKTLERFSNTIMEDEIVLIKGRVTKREDEQPKILCDYIEKIVNFSNKKFYIQVDKKNDVKLTINKIKAIAIR